MAHAKKVAITVDAELFARAERLRRSTDESRSAVFARALRALLREEERKRRSEAYVDAYRRVPETSSEVEWVDSVSAAGLADVVWDE